MESLSEKIFKNPLEDFEEEITGTDVLRHYWFNLSFEKSHVSLFLSENMEKKIISL